MQSFESRSKFDEVMAKTWWLACCTTMYYCLQICIADEKALFEVCMAWFEHSPDDRQKDLCRVMKSVRFANIDPYYFYDRVESNGVLRECQELNQLFDTVRSYHMLPNRRAEVFTMTYWLLASLCRMSVCLFVHL